MVVGEADLELGEVPERLLPLQARLDRSGGGIRQAALRYRQAKVPAIVNYQNFSIGPELVDAYSDMVRDLVERFYSDVTRYTTSGFVRIKLGEALAERSVAPHIYESADEARARLQELERRGR